MTMRWWQVTIIIQPYGFGAHLNRVPDAGVGDMVVLSVKNRPKKKSTCIVNPKCEMKGSAISRPVAKEYSCLPTQLCQVTIHHPAAWVWSRAHLNRLPDAGVGDMVVLSVKSKPRR